MRSIEDKESGEAMTVKVLIVIGLYCRTQAREMRRSQCFLRVSLCSAFRLVDHP
jgi:hypothetical protein